MPGSSSQGERRQWQYTSHDIVRALQKQLQQEYGPEPELPLRILLLLAQLKEAEQDACVEAAEQ